jgi:hypothetical protein
MHAPPRPLWVTTALPLCRPAVPLHHCTAPLHYITVLSLGLARPLSHTQEAVGHEVSEDSQVSEHVEDQGEAVGQHRAPSTVREGEPPPVAVLSLAMSSRSATAPILCKSIHIAKQYQSVLTNSDNTAQYRNMYPKKNITA